MSRPPSARLPFALLGLVSVAASAIAVFSLNAHWSSEAELTALLAEHHRVQKELREQRTASAPAPSAVEASASDAPATPSESKSTEGTSAEVDSTNDVDTTEAVETVAALKAELQTASLNLARASSERDMLRNRIGDLTRKRTKPYGEYAKSDGAIDEIEAGGWWVWIDVGSVQGLRPRTMFHVVVDVDGGGQRVKAVLQVRHVLPNRSRCAVLADQQVLDPNGGGTVTVPDSAFPIAVGDSIRNPFFDPKKTRVFVFLGERLESQHTLTSVQQRIVDYGGRVDPAVTLKTDFVVALDEDRLAEQFKLATALGVVFMREEELLEYLNLEN